MTEGTGSVVHQLSRMRAKFVERVYATHNSSTIVREILASNLGALGDGDKALNVGSGNRRLHPQVINLDITAGAGVDVVASAEKLPFSDNYFALVITQETLEHVRDPFESVQEMYRVLRPGGTLYCQVPFTIGYHPGPTDYWRFTKEGVLELIERAGFDCEAIYPSVGAAVGFYRIAVEFASILVANVGSPLYHPAKATFALVLYPIKYLDRVLSVQRDRIAGGYIAVARKPGKSENLQMDPDRQALQSDVTLGLGSSAPPIQNQQNLVKS